jgi:RoxA-like, cytochrome c-like
VVRPSSSGSPRFLRSVRTTQGLLPFWCRSDFASIHPKRSMELFQPYFSAATSARPSPGGHHGTRSRLRCRSTSHDSVHSRIIGKAECHPPPLFTDLHEHDVGTRRGFDRPGDKFHTPTLVELWRTAPYLHDGSAATVRDVLTTRNAHDQHGKTSN